MRIAIVGFYNQYIYEDAFSHGLEFNGIKVIRVDLKKFWCPKFPRFSALVPACEPSLINFNKVITDYLLSINLDFVLFWRPTHILPETIKILKGANLKTISYNNDDPFGHKTPNNRSIKRSMLWYYYLKILPLFDYNYFYREINCIEALQNGAKHADILLPYFIPNKNYNIKLNNHDKITYQTDITFVGHYEKDGRDEYLNALLINNFDVKIWGGVKWRRSSTVTKGFYKKAITQANGKNYEIALCGAKICLAFMSKLNRDTYTRRCFEIPACGKVLLAPRTKDLSIFYTENVEACFFDSPEELIEKVNWLLTNDYERENIAKAGQKRVWALGASVEDRALQFINNLRDKEK